MLATRKRLMDSGYRNLLRKVTNGSVLYMPALPEGFESGVIKDYSGYNNNGTITGATWARLPSGLWVLIYDGNDKVTVTSNTDFDFATGPFTIKIWVYFDSVIGQSRIFCRKPNGTDFGWILYLEAATDFSFISASSSGWDNVALISSGVVPVAGTWYHVAVTRSGNTFTMYRNGTSIKTGDNANSVGGEAVDVILGAEGGGTQPLVGRTALPSAFSRALSLSEIANSYNQERHLFKV